MPLAINLELGPPMLELLKCPRGELFFPQLSLSNTNYSSLKEWEGSKKKGATSNKLWPHPIHRVSFPLGKQNGCHQILLRMRDP